MTFCELASLARIRAGNSSGLCVGFNGVCPHANIANPVDSTPRTPKILSFDMASPSAGKIYVRIFNLFGSLGPLTIGIPLVVRPIANWLPSQSQFGTHFRQCKMSVD